MEDSGRHPLSGEVYIHCHAAVCRPSAQETCSPTCRPPSRRRRNIAVLAPQDHKVLVSSGPVIFKNSEPQPAVNHFSGVEKKRGKSFQA
nr:PREDICTED: zona pellucida sperm-binding protein 4-like [Latimeria chalumnae]|eukprot:XP_014351264.1 PREDICTED: zona pellucida sperm-binding protein 4-like [Latimeria chalumnae]